MRLMLALLTLSISLPATAATTKTKTKKAAPAATKATYGDLEGPVTPAARTPTSKARGGVSQLKVTSPTSTTARAVEISPTVGVNLNSISGMEDFFKDQKIKNYSVSPDTGFSVGATADLGIGFASTVLQTGLIYSQVNQKFTVEKSDYSWIQNYLSVPLEGKTYFLGGRSRLFMNYGFVGNFILSADQKGPRETTNLKDKLNSFNLGGVIGVGWVQPFGPNVKGVASLSLNRSLTKINSEGDTSFYNNTFGLNVGVQL